MSRAYSAGAVKLRCYSVLPGASPLNASSRLHSAITFADSSSMGFADKHVMQWGSEQPTAVTLQDLCEIGLDRARRRQHGIFLHRELRIRLAQRALELKALPGRLPERKGIREVIQWYSDFVIDLEDCASPVSAREDEEFTSLLTRIFEEHSEVIQAVAMGVHELMAEMGEDYAELQPEVDAVLRRFFMARIGLRFLLQHHIESFRNREGHSGILELDCSPAEILRRASKDAVMLCRATLGQAPPVLVHETLPKGGGDGTFTYVPMHLHYMLTEVVKNACRAVTERHAEGFDDDLPPVRCQIVHGAEDVTIRISDEGGGISRARLQDIWKFTYTTCKKTPWEALHSRHGKPATADSASNPLQRPRPGAAGVLAGYGVGLTLSRLYAQYFGGDLRLMSLDGYGTDVFLHLSRLGTHCENLPRVVLYSPSMRDSSAADAWGEQEERLLISADEEAYLRKELAAFRQRESSRGEAPTASSVHPAL